MSFLTADPLNCEIIAHSLGLQRQIPVITHPDGSVVGSQQAMPKPEHRNLFGPENPLPWVPDRVGTEFSRENNGVLVVGSSYNGFIEGYSQRSMKLEHYLAIRDLIREGNEDPAHPKVTQACAKFIQDFETQVMQPDRATYYGPIFDDLLRVIPPSLVCLTDVCKASYVERPKPSNGRSQLDNGGDTLICNSMEHWSQHLTCRQSPEPGLPSPYHWLWRRMQNAAFVVPLGVLAEYGVLKIFKAINPQATIRSQNVPGLCPQGPIGGDALTWVNPYEHDRIPASRWHSNNDWWVLEDGSLNKRKWFVLPVYHPNFRTRSSDPDYSRSRTVLEAMIGKFG